MTTWGHRLAGVGIGLAIVAWWTWAALAYVHR